MLLPFADENPASRPPVVTGAIIVINLLAYLWMSRLPERELRVLMYERAFVPARMAQLETGQPIKAPLLEQAPGEPRPRVVGEVQLQPLRAQILFSLFSSMFMHGGWMHVLGNMWFLWIFGNNVEDRLGHTLYGFFYVCGGLVAAGCHWLTDTTSLIPVVGASGAVAAVLGGYAITFPHARVRTLVLWIVYTVIDLPAYVVLGLWFVLQVVSGLQALEHLGLGGGVAWWAHIGGFAMGLIAMPMLAAFMGRAPPSGQQDVSSWFDDVR